MKRVFQTISRLPFLPALPLHIYGLWGVAGASLLLAVVSVLANWRRPVSAISDIPFRSQISRLTGQLPATPAAKFEANLLAHDSITMCDGLLWEHVQRLNLHEVGEHSINTLMHLVATRGTETIETTTRVVQPDLWESLVLARWGLGALVCWIPPTLILWTLTRELLHRSRTSDTLPNDTSGVSLWFLSFQAISISQSIGGMKYPVAWFWTDVLARVVPLFLAAASWPYPLAPRHLRPRWIESCCVGASLLITGILFWQAAHSPYAHSDWRRSIQILYSKDLAMQAAFLIHLPAFIPIIGGIVVTAYSRPILRLLQKIETSSKDKHNADRRHPPQHSPYNRLIHWLEQIYEQCPTSLGLIARCQFVILLTYTLFDLLPCWLGGSGAGYSVLFAGIPFSYLLLYTDQPAQQLGHRIVTIMVVGAISVQMINLILRLAGILPHQVAIILDMTTILCIATGTVLGGLMIAITQWWRNRKISVDPVQEAIDGLFTQQSQQVFWQHLIKEVGQQVGITGWLWARYTTTGTWDILEKTDTVRPEWIAVPHVQHLLTTLSANQPRSITVDRTSLPNTLVVLPIYREEQLSEVLLAANPEQIHKGMNLEHNLAVSGRLMHAVSVLRRREHEQVMVHQSMLIAEQQREISRRQREVMFRDNHRFSSLLHDETLSQLARLNEHIRRTSGGYPEQQAALQQLEHECNFIAQNLRRIAHELRPAGAKQLLEYTLDHTVMEWEQQHPTVCFDYEFTADEIGLTEYQRDTIYQIISQLVENALRHAQPTHIAIRVLQQPQHLVFEVRDDGVGFNPAHISPHSLGLLQRKDMAQELNGTLDIISQPGQGCWAVLTIPYTPVMSQEESLDREEKEN